MIVSSNYDQVSARVVNQVNPMDVMPHPAAGLASILDRVVATPFEELELLVFAQRHLSWWALLKKVSFFLVRLGRARAMTGGDWDQGWYGWRRLVWGRIRCKMAGAHDSFQQSAYCYWLAPEPFLGVWCGDCGQLLHGRVQNDLLEFDP